MAVSTDFLTEWADGNVGGGEFRPYADYGAEEDAMIFFFRPDPYKAKRLNSRVTVYLSLDTGELVGCQIKSVRHVLDDIGEFDVNIEHGKISLTILFAAFRNEFLLDNEDCGRSAFRQIGRAARDAQLSLDV